MDIQARKYQLIERVMRFSEDELEKVETFLDNETELSASLDRALQQIKDEEVIPHTDVRKKFEKWL